MAFADHDPVAGLPCIVPVLVAPIAGFPDVAVTRLWHDLDPRRRRRDCNVELDHARLPGGRIATAATANAEPTNKLRMFIDHSMLIVSAPPAPLCGPIFSIDRSELREVSRSTPKSAFFLQRDRTASYTIR
jgi:hypothetical protein